MNQHVFSLFIGSLYSLQHTLIQIIVFDYHRQLSRYCDCHLADEKTEDQREGTCPGSNSYQWQSQALNSLESFDSFTSTSMGADWLYPSGGLKFPTSDIKKLFSRHKLLLFTQFANPPFLIFAFLSVSCCNKQVPKCIMFQARQNIHHEYSCLVGNFPPRGKHLGTRLLLFCVPTIFSLWLPKVVGRFWWA